MRPKYLVLIGAGLSLTFILACITVNIYFPEAAVQKTADEIVNDVRKKDVTDKTPPEPVKKDGMSAKTGFSFVPYAFGQEETTVSTPSIRALKDSMRQRFLELKSFYDKGNIGESNAGMVEIRDEGSLNLKDKAALRGLVRDENNDRTKLYAEVAKALKIDPGQIGRVQAIFAASWINNAAAGWWIQKEDGTWVKK